MELLVVLLGLGATIVIITAIVMVDTWGLEGTIGRVLGVAALVGIILAAWRNRSRVAAYVERRRAEAAAQAEAAAVALAAFEARKPKALGGQFPPGMTFLGVQSLATDRGTIPSVMTYVTCRSSPTVDEPSLIAAELLVTPFEYAHPGELPYWPSYRDIGSDQRAVYLQWMISGRQQLPQEIGYAFLFFYGLERRALADQLDQQMIFTEVLRLRHMNAHADSPNRSFAGYTTAFLWFLVMAFPTAIDRASVKALTESTNDWDEESLSAALSWFAQTETALPWWMAIVMARQLPGSQQSVVTKRVGSRFRELFQKRYGDRHGTGIMVKLSKRPRAYTYKAASAVLKTVQAKGGPNPLGIQSQFKALSDLWNSCIQDLRGLSSVARREEEQAKSTPEMRPEIHEELGHKTRPVLRQEVRQEMTPAAWEAMPAELRASTDHPLTTQVCKLMQNCTDEEGRTLIRVPQLATALCWEWKQRYSLDDSTWLCKTTEECGYCIEPDPRLTGTTYQVDDTITAFLKNSDETADIGRYRTAACMLRLGMIVASADGNVHEDELAVILQDIRQLFDLNEHERRRLDSLRGLLMATGPNLSGLTAMVKTLQPVHRQAIAKLLLVVAAKDGQVTREEVQAIRKCYRTLGMDQAEIGQAMASLKAYQQDDEPVTIQAGGPTVAGEAIPAPKHQPVLQLNRAAIAQIMKDTQEVAKLLAEAMAGGQEPAKEQFTTPFIPPEPIAVAVVPLPSSQVSTGDAEATASAEAITSADTTLPQRYASFYQLLVSRQGWDLKEIDGLARQQGLMLSGAIDALNEWAAEKYGGQLFIEDGNQLVVEQSYLN